MFKNPFIVGRAIRPGEQFVGRLAIKQTIVSHLSNMGSTSVIGERRTGKTSLLLEVQRQLREFTGPLPFTSVYIDCSTTPTVTSFWKQFVEGLRIEADKTLIVQMDRLGLFDLTELEAASHNIIRTFSSTNSIVMLLDEFDYTLESNQFPSDFLLRLRNYGSLSQVAYITASRQRLEAHYTNPTPSPFFNIFLAVILGLFSEMEARALLQQSLIDGSSVFNEEETEYLLEISGSHPFFLQLAAFILYRIKYNQAEEPLSDWKSEHRKAFEASARQHIEYYWKKSSPEEKQLLISLCKGNQVRLEERKAFRTLTERSLVIKKQDQARPFSPIFAEWILQDSISNEEDNMIEAIAVPVLVKAVEFIFGEGSKILQERRQRRNAQEKPVDAALVSTVAVNMKPTDAISSKPDALSCSIEQSVWQNSEAKVKHLSSLLETYTKNYYLAREKYAKWGSALVPPIIVQELTEAEDGIANTTRELETILTRVYGKRIFVPELDKKDESSPNIASI
jgi:hypothetical protein